MQPKDKKPWRRGSGVSFPLQLLLGFVVVGGLMYGLPRLLERLGMSWWLLPALLLITPLAVVIIDMAQGNLKPTLFNGLFAYLGYTFRTGLMLVIVLGSVGILFMIGPVWLFAVFFTLVDIVMYLLPNVQAANPPILCGLADIGSANCVPALGAYHVISAILIFLAYRCGDRLFDYVATWYHYGSEWFGRQIEN